MPRLFVAVWPPGEVLERLAALPRPETPGLRWTEPHQWHVTLRFLGHVPEVDVVGEALAGVGAGGPVTAVVGPTVGRFGQRVLHVPVTGLEGIAAAVVGRTAHLGRPPEDRPFTGHFTLARAAKTGRADLRPLVGARVEARWEVDAVCLVESNLSRTGARYEIVERFPLGGADAQDARP